MEQRSKNAPLPDLHGAHNGAGRSDRLQFPYAYALCRHVLLYARKMRAMRVRSTLEILNTVALEWTLMVYDGRGKNIRISIFNSRNS